MTTVKTCPTCLRTEHDASRWRANFGIACPDTFHTPTHNDTLAPLDELVEIADALNMYRKTRVCAYGADEAGIGKRYVCDCKYGEPSARAGTEATGCPEIREVVAKLRATISTLRTSIEEERERYRGVAEEVDAVVERMMHEAWPPERLRPRLVRLQAVAQRALSTMEAKDG